MASSRRNFLRTTGPALGVATLPSWVGNFEAVEAAAVDKPKLADIALSAARKLAATYADIRINRYRSESIETREKQVQQVERGQSFGFGVRVLVKGTWGFAASRNVKPDEARRITQLAVEVARANSAYQLKPIQLVPVAKAVGSWKSSFEIDPFDVPPAFPKDPRRLINFS